MNITVKQLESMEIGIIRAEHLKNTLRGRIYKATVYYENDSVDVAILYYRNGGGKILGPVVKEEKELTHFTNFLKYIAPRIPKPNQKIIKALITGITIALIFTIANILSTSTITDLYIDALDIAISLILIILYRRERSIYERE